MDSEFHEIDPASGPHGDAPSVEAGFLLNYFLSGPDGDPNDQDYPPVTTGIYTTEDGPYLDPSEFIPDGISGSQLTSVPQSSLFYCQVGNIGDVGSTIQVTLTGGDGASQQIDLDQQDDGTYYSRLPILAFDGDIDASVQASMSASWSLVIVHNDIVKATYGNLVTTAATATLQVDAAHKYPNILLANGYSTTRVIFHDGKGRPGIKVQFEVPIGSGSIDPGLKTTDEKGNATATYTGTATTSTATITAFVEGTDVELQTYVYNEEINFWNLYENDGLADYTDEAFPNATAMSAADIQTFFVSYNCFLKGYTDPVTGKSAARIISDACVASSVNPKIVLCTLEKEQSLLGQRTPIADSNGRMQAAMGIRVDVTAGFANQVAAGCKAFSK